MSFCSWTYKDTNDILIFNQNNYIHKIYRNLSLNFVMIKILVESVISKLYREFKGKMDTKEEKEIVNNSTTRCLRIY